MAERESLPKVMEKTSRELAGRIKDLAIGVSEALNNNGGPSSPAEIAAAFHMIAQLSTAGSSILKESGVIFNNSQTSKKLDQALAQVSAKPDEKAGKETQGVERDHFPTKEEQERINQLPFNKLLRKKIEERLLTPEETTFTKTRLQEIAKKIRYGISGINALSDFYNLSSTESLDREQAIDLIGKILKTRQERKSSYESENIRDQAHGRTYLIQYFRLKAEQLDVWAMEASFNWEKNKTIDKHETDAIYGLAKLDKSPIV